MEIKNEILKRSEAYRDYTANLLAKMIQTPAFSGREEARCKLIKQLCEEAGLEDVHIDGLGSVVARVGRGPKKIAFDAHVDTVEVGDRSQWKTDPHSGEIKDGLVYGLGASDQLGGAASMIAAGKMLKDLNYDGAYTVYFTFTVIEEDCDGIAWIYLIEKENLRPDYIISTEPTACKLFRGQRGRMEIEVLLKGVSSHGSIPESGHSAAYLASRAALAIEQLNHELPPDKAGLLGKGSITVSQMDAAGPSQCSVPDKARLYLDRRLTWGEDAAFAIRQVTDCVTKAMGEAPEKVHMPYYNKPGYRNVDFGQELYFPTWITEESHELVVSARKAYKALYDVDLTPGFCTFSTNAVSFCGRYHIPSIIMGPGDLESIHRPNETTRINDLVVCSAVYTLLPYIMP